MKLRGINSIRKMLIVPGLAILCLAGSQSWAANQRANQKMASSASLPDKEQKSPWGFGSTYTYSSDQMKTSEKRASKHKLDLGANYSFKNKLGIAIETNAQWIADGNNVRKTEDNVIMDDLEISLASSDELKSGLGYIWAISDALPTGYASRTEGTRNTLTALGGLSISFLKSKIKLGSVLSHSFIQQTYDYSVTSGESNPDSLTTATLGITYKPLAKLAFDIKYTAWSLHTINGENNLLRNQSALGAAYKFNEFAAFAKYSIGNYDKSDSLKMFYFDETRQTISLGVSFEI